MRILYVENHTVFAKNVVQQFLSSHYVIIVPSLSSARLALSKEAFDLLLVDFDLDDGKGDELVKELKDSGSPVPIIGVSSHDAGNQKLIAAGAKKVCPKMHFDNIQAIIDSIK